MQITIPMKIFSSDEIENIRRYTLKEQGITQRQFIDMVGESLAVEIISTLVPGHRLVVFAGPELNGAYALATARHLAAQGYRSEVYLFNIKNRATPDCVAMRDRLREEVGDDSIIELTEMQFSIPDLTSEMTLIDGLFGTERTAPLSGGYQSIVRYINEMGPRVVSIDVPSGMLVDSVDGLINRNIIHASLTLVIGVPRVVFFLKETAELLGKWKVVPVDYAAEALERAPWRFRVLDKNDVRQIIQPRGSFASKADCGHAMLFAGSYGMLGAAQLCARGALRAGAGKVTVHGPRCAFYAMQIAVPCAMFDCDNGDTCITDFDLNRNYEAVAIGPGLGTADSTIDALHQFLKVANANSRPLILDADALNCMSIRPSMLDHIPVLSIITPHEGEFDRLFGKQTSSYARLLKAIDVARRRHIIIILKGHYTAIVRPDGKVYFNPTGGPELATGGTGDVLTGILAALVAQGMRMEFASVVGPYIHGIAGEIAAETHGVYGVTAEDVAECIGKAFNKVIL